MNSVLRQTDWCAVGTNGTPRPSCARLLALSSAVMSLTAMANPSFQEPRSKRLCSGSRWFANSEIVAVVREKSRTTRKRGHYKNLGVTVNSVLAASTEITENKVTPKIS